MKPNLTWNSIVFVFAIILMVTGLWACGDTDNDNRDNHIDPVDNARSYIYVTLARDGQVAVIDEATEKVVKTVDVGAGPAIIIATPDNRKVYTANWGDNTISAIETNTYESTTILTSINSTDIVGRPFIIAMSPDGRYVYAGLFGNRIDVINTETDTVEKYFSTDTLPASLFVSPDGGTLYVATIKGQDPAYIWGVSTEDGKQVLEPIPIGAAPGWITMSPDGTQVFALNFYSDDVSVINTQDWIVDDTIYTGEGSEGVIGNVTPDNSALYITNLGTGDLIAIDTQSYEIQKIPLNGRPGGVHFNEDGSHIYVTHYGPQSLENDTNKEFLLTGVWSKTDPGYVDIIRADTGEIISEIEVGPGPTSVVGITHD